MSRYSAYGLRIDSEVPLPELLPAEDGPADVTVRLGSVPMKLTDPLREYAYFEGKPGTFLFRVARVARYMVVGGKEIVIEPLPDCSEELLRIFLLGSSFGALLHQRHLLVMHASSVQTADGAVLFVGPSGHGKSTVLAALARRGHAMLADDVTVIEVDDASGPVAFPSFPRQRLGADVAEELDYRVDSLPQIENSDKYLVSVGRFCTHPLPVRTVYALGVHEEDDIRIEPVNSLRRFEVVGSNAYRYEFLECLGLREMHFRAATRLLETVQVRSVTRPASSLLLDELIDRLEEELGEPAAKTEEKVVT